MENSAKMARIIVRTLFCAGRVRHIWIVQNIQRRTAIEPDGVKMLAKGRVKPRSSIAKTQMHVPANMYGLRRPNRDLELSARIPSCHIPAVVGHEKKWSVPMRGCTTSPDIGPARKTVATADLESPKEMRYGVP